VPEERINNSVPGILSERVESLRWLYSAEMQCGAVSWDPYVDNTIRFWIL